MDFKLPALPTALAEVIQIQRASSPDSTRLVEIIERDPALALYVLRQVNSAYYGLRKQVSPSGQFGLLRAAQASQPDQPSRDAVGGEAGV